MSNQQWEKPDLPQHKPGFSWENWRLPTTSQLTLFCTEQTLFRTILDQGSSLLSQNCRPCAAAFAVEIWAQMGPNDKDTLSAVEIWAEVGSNNKQSLEEQPVHLATITPSILAPVHLARPGWLPRQAKPLLLRGWHGTWNKSHWPWNVKSTMRNARSSPTQTWNLLGKLEAFYNFAASLFCTEQTLFRTILDQGSSLLPQSCSSCAAAFACRDLGRKWDEQQGHIVCWQLGRTTCAPCYCYTSNTGTCAVSKTRVASKTSKTTTASWLAWNLKQIPLAFEMSNQKRIASGKLEATYNFAASLFCTEQTLFRTILDQGSSLLSQNCRPCAAAFAVEIWAQMGRTTRTPCLL